MLAPATVGSTILISLNGEPRTVHEDLTVSTLLLELGLDRRKVAVERNEAIVPRSVYETIRVEAGDKFEIVHFIGGG